MQIFASGRLMQVSQDERECQPFPGVPGRSACSTRLGSAARWAGCSTRKEEITPVFAVSITYEQRARTGCSDK